MQSDWIALWMFVLSLAAGGCAWFLRTMHSDLRTLERCVNTLAQRFAGDAVRTESAGARLQRIEDKLDAIAASLSQKVDREECRNTWAENHHRQIR